MARVQIDHVRITYPGGLVPLEDVCLNVASGEYLTLVGVSGTGKTTLLRLIAGLERPERGTIRIGGSDVARLPPDRRGVAMVFQSDALFAHLSVRANIALGLRARGVDRARIRERIDEAADALGITALLGRKPTRLSGGERRRVSLARAVVRRSEVVLLDEPLSALDETARRGARALLRELQARFGLTMLHVTHDQEEALALGQRVAVLDAGVIQQCAPPETLTTSPASLSVAKAVVGSDLTLVPGVLLRGPDAMEFAESAPASKSSAPVGWRLPLPQAAALDPGPREARQVTLAIPAHAWHDPAARGDHARVQIHVVGSEWAGNSRRLIARTPDGTPILVRRLVHEPPIEPGSATLSFAWRDAWLFAADGARIPTTDAAGEGRPSAQR